MADRRGVLGSGEDQAGPLDGRRRRSRDSRAKIVAAMLELTQAGVINPVAEQVAARAGVGLRSVFRHFKDMDSLYGEMYALIEAEVRTIIDQPLKSADWRGQVKELVQRRGEVFERIAPYKHASDIQRHRSAFLQEGHDRFAAVLRQILVGVLPAEIAADPLRLEALDLLLSFEAWFRMRRDQKLTPRECREVLEAAVTRMLA